VPDYLDLTMIGIAFLVWPVTKSVIVTCAAVTTFWSHDERRLKAAEHILHVFGSGEHQPPS
jgi:hypothetical protein